MGAMTNTGASALTSPADGPAPLSQAWLSSERLLDWIISCQADPAAGTAYLGDTPDGVRAELEGLDQDWRDTVRVVTVHGEPVAACAVEWDEEPAMAWIQGPWGSPDVVETWGEALVQSVVDQLPPPISTLELCGEVRNTALSDLAGRLGWTPTAVNYAMVLPVKDARSVVAEPRVTSPSEITIRDAAETDLPCLAELHESEFPEAYATAAQLLTRHLTVVAVDDETLAGYASGQVQDDGQAYIDFTAVDPAVRRRGVGRSLILALIDQLLQAADAGRVTQVQLTVRDEKEPARALYESLGFRTDAAIRGYRGTRSGS